MMTFGLDAAADVGGGHDGDEEDEDVPEDTGLKLSPLMDCLIEVSI